jgi:hypothetical protein
LLLTKDVAVQAVLEVLVGAVACYGNLHDDNKYDDNSDDDSTCDGKDDDKHDDSGQIHAHLLTHEVVMEDVEVVRTDGEEAAGGVVPGLMPSSRITGTCK